MKERGNEALVDSVEQLESLLEWFSSIEEQFAGMIQFFRLNGENKVIELHFDIFAQLRLYFADLVITMTTLEKMPEGSYLQRVAAAKAIHGVYEAKGALDRWFMKKIREVTLLMGIEFKTDKIKAVREKYEAKLAVIETWEEIRNKVTGHYDPDLKKNVDALDGINIQAVIEAVHAQLQVLSAVLDIMVEGVDSIDFDPFGIDIDYSDPD